MTAVGGVVELDLSGITIRVRGLDDALSASLHEHWGPYIVEASARPALLDIVVGPSGEPLTARPVMRPSLNGDVSSDRARFTSDEGAIDVGADGAALTTLRAGDSSWRFWGFANLFTAALAYRMPSRPGAVLHAAGIVVADRAFLLIGPSGAGKSTWALAALAAGALVISDDSVVVDAASGRVELLGTPIRAHESRRAGRGRWRVAAILHARWGSPPRLAPVKPLQAHARLTANLLYLASGWGRDPRLDAVIDVLAERVPHRELTFAPDHSFVDLLRSAE